MRLQSLSFRYGRGTLALKDCNVTLRGPVIAVLGANGAGKSTLLRLLTTEARPSQGTVVCAGWSSDDTGAAQREYRARLGVMPQRLDMAPGYTCEQVLRYVAWLRAVPPRLTDARVTSALQSVDLTQQRQHRVKRLSGGMRQRLGLAQAVVNDPDVLVLDEPTVGLDPQQRVDFRRRLMAARDRALVVLATHLVDDVAVLADDVLVLDQGSVAFAGSLRQFCGLSAAGVITGEDVERAYLDLVGAST